MIKNFIDNDIEVDDDVISELYQFAKKLDSNKNNINESVIEMYRILASFGTFDSTIKDSNDFYEEKIGENYSGILTTNPFVISEKKSAFFENHYKSMKQPEEIYPNAMLLANRLAKLSETLIILNARQNNVRFSTEQDYNKIMSDLYSKYEVSRKNDGWDFLDDIKFDEFGNLDNKNNGQEDILKYEKLKKEFNEYIAELSSKYEGLNIQDINDKEMHEFQKFAKLKYCEPIFYKAKCECLLQCIDLAKNSKRIKVYNVTEHDEIKKTDKTDRRLIRIDVAGYSSPFLQHFLRNNLQNIYGIDIDTEIRSIPLEKYKGHPIFNFKLNKEQIDFVKSISNQLVGCDQLYKQVVEYMKESILLEEKATAIDEREKNKKKLEENKGDKFNMEDSRSKRVKYKEDKEFIYEELVPSLKKIIGRELPEDYIEKLESNKRRLKLHSGYTRMEEFIKSKVSEKDDIDVKTEAIKMFTYMRVFGRGFWDCMQRGDETRQKIYEEVYKEYNIGFDKISEAIEKGKSVDEIRKEERNEKNIKNKPHTSTIKKKYNKPKYMTKKEGKTVINSIPEIEGITEADYKNHVLGETKKESEKTEILKSILGSQEMLISIRAENIKLAEEVLKNNQKIKEQEGVLNELYAQLGISEGVEKVNE